MRVPTLTLIFISLDLFLCVAIPTALLIFVWRKWRLSVKPFFIGAAIMLMFSFALESMLHAIVFATPLGATIQGNVWLYALYGGLSAALFEELGRFLAMRYAMRTYHREPRTALVYGFGHGCLELLLVLGLVMVSDLLYATLVNSGGIEAFMEPMDAASQASFQAMLAELTDPNSFLFLLAPAERIAALVAQCAFSVMVWIAATQPGQGKLLVLALLLHTVIDAAASCLQALGVTSALIIALVAVMAAAYAVLAKKLYERHLTPAL